MVPGGRGRKGGLDASLREELRSLDIDGLALDAPAGEVTAFRCGGPADAVVRVGDLESWGRLLAWCRDRKVAVLPLGHGCGVVIRRSGVVGVVVSTRGLSGIERLADAAADDSRVRLRARAGATCEALARMAAREGAGEWGPLVGIGGTVGGLLARHWPDVRARVVAVGLLGDRGRVRVRDAEELGDKLPLPGRTALAWATFAFPPAEEQQRLDGDRITTDGAAVAEPDDRGKIRLFRELDGGQGPGEVLADLGVCGIRLRGVAIDDRDPNLAINLGDGVAEDLDQLARYVKRRARESAGVELEEAFRFVGKK